MSRTEECLDEGFIVSDQFMSMSSEWEGGKKTCEKPRAELLLSKAGVRAHLSTQMSTTQFGKFDAARVITRTFNPLGGVYL